MTRYDPTLFLNRLLVLKSGKAAYDEKFHVGINVIRSDGNSRGKSTIADLIFFALGGDDIEWKPEAASCSEVYAEVSINGGTVTLRREITDKNQQPMWIYWGCIDEALGGSGWERYPYKRYLEKDGFSQVLFRVADLPDVQGDVDTNITMHQLLRLMYVDQLTPVDRIFRFDNRDTPNRRQAVGDLLCGVYDHRIYPSQITLRQKENQLEAAMQRLGALMMFLDKAGQGFAIETSEVRRPLLVEEREKLLTEIAELKAQRLTSAPVSGETRDFLLKLSSDLSKVNTDTANAEAQIRAIEVDVADSELLADDLVRNLRELDQSQMAAATLGEVTFNFCPSCYSSVEIDAGHLHSCPLCKTPRTESDHSSRTLRIRNELEVQLKETRKLIETRKQTRAETSIRLDGLMKIRGRLSSEYVRLTKGFVSDLDSNIESLIGRVGYVEREIAEAETQERLSAEITRLRKERDELNKEVETLKKSIQKWIDEKQRREEHAYGIIKSMTAKLLERDVQSEQEFSEGADVFFSFGEDRVSVNGKRAFSASSLTVIRNAFHVGLLLASASDRRFGYPRFLLLDNTEDKGMTEARSRNFQKSLLELFSSVQVPYQLIYTTSMVAPELDCEPYTVGEKYTYDNKSLKIESH